MSESRKRSARRILVIGGGFGGAAAARLLRKELDAEHRVTLVDRSRMTYLCGSFPWLIIGEREAAKVSRSLGTLVSRGVEVVTAEVEGVALSERRVATSVGDLHYDYLIVATGVDYDWNAVPGSDPVDGVAHSFYSLDTARRLRRRLRGFKGGDVVLSVARLPYKCPPAPYEAALLIEAFLAERGVRSKTTITVTTPEPTPLGVAGPGGPEWLRREFGRRGIELLTGETPVEVDGSAMKFKSGATLPCDLAITIPAHRSRAVVADADLVGESGWIEVDARTLATGHPGVYAIGDATVIKMENGRPLPKAGVFAAGAGEAAARNIVADITGGEAPAYDGKGFCFLDMGRGKGALLGGEFLAAGGPKVTLSDPSVRWHRKKVRFEADWRRFKV